MNYLLILLLIMMPLLGGCQQDTDSTALAPTGAQDAAPKAPPEATGFSGEVLETMSGGGYTYARVKTAQGEVWCAAPQMALTQGDEVLAPAGMLMKNFRSKALDRDFEQLLFLESLVVAGAPIAQAAPASGGLPAGHPPIGGSQQPEGHPAVQTLPTPDLPEIQKVEGGYTVEEVFAKKADLAGQEITVRGMVVKFNPQIMGTNWLHLMDGSGKEGTNDLTVTSNDTMQKGQVVTAKGKLAIDKDFGYGYKYAVILEDAKLVAE